MINFIERIQLFKAERSLLMSYCVSLPFFEQEVLEYLQEAGEGRVTLLLNEQDYQNSFSDFVKSAGVRYRFNAVRLPNPKSNFHPKIYLLLKQREARLLVTSANLTPSGFRNNLEVVDELSLSNKGEGDSRAFSQFVEMLRSLVNLDRRLPKPVGRELNELAGTLAQWIGSNTGGSNPGPQFLHSVNQPLLQQLRQLVPSDQIEEIVAVSPFFDEQSTAILKLAEAYPAALVRIIKSGDERSLAGQPLAKSRNRIVVDQLLSARDEKDRRLHAKVLIFRGTGRLWLVSGSANLTRSALLSAAEKGGNVEAVVTREYEDNVAIPRLLNGIETQRMDLEKLAWHAEALVLGPAVEQLTIIDAYVKDRQILIFVETDLSASDVRFRVAAMQGGLRAESVPTVERQNDGSLLLRIRALKEHVDAEIPIAIIVEAHRTKETIASARSWVAIPSALSLNAMQRDVRISTRSLCQRVFADDDAASVVSDEISRFLGELAELSAQPDKTGGSNSQATKNEGENEEDRQLSVDDFVITDEELGRLRDATARTAQTLAGLAALLKRLLIFSDEADDETPANVQLDSEEPDEEEQQRKEPILRREVVKATDLLDELTQRFQNTVRQALTQPLCASAVPFVCNLPTALIAYLLLHARIRQRLRLEPTRELAHTLRDIFPNLLSIEGALLGSSFGWLIRARVSDRCQPALTALLANRDRLSQLFAFVAAGLVVVGSAALNRSVLGGLHFVTGEMPAQELPPEFQLQIRRIAAASGGQIRIEEISKVLSSYSPLDLVGLRAAQKWSQAAVGVYCQPLDNQAGISCRKRQLSLPAKTVAQLSQVDGDVVCPYCGRVIAPLKQHSTETDTVLRWFRSVQAVIQ